METDLLIQGIEVEGARLADAAERAGLDARVPTCPLWQVRDLVWHTGGMHRWAAEHILTPTKMIVKTGPMRSHSGDMPADVDLIEWYLNEVQLLVETLSACPDDLETAIYLLEDAPKHFWARRQCHEAGIHRIDAELSGGNLTPTDPARAADGIDEMLFGFARRSVGNLVSDDPLVMVIAPGDVGDRWTMRIGSGPPEVTREEMATADLNVSGDAAAIYRCLWNRGAIAELELTGNSHPLELFKERIRVGW